MNIPLATDIALHLKAELPHLIRQATQLSRPDLAELHDAIAGLLDVIDLDQVRRDRQATQTQTTPKREARGWYEYSYKTRDGKRYGPYCYFRYWSGGKKKSRYIGKALARPLMGPY